MKQDSKISGLWRCSAGPLKRTSRRFGQGTKTPANSRKRSWRHRRSPLQGDRVLTEDHVMALVGETLRKIRYDEIRKRSPTNQAIRVRRISVTCAGLLGRRGRRACHTGTTVTQ